MNGIVTDDIIYHISRGYLKNEKKPVPRIARYGRIMIRLFPIFTVLLEAISECRFVYCHA
jgi:hypothetical protein